VLSEVAQVIDVIRPAIQADGGDIALVGVDEATGVVQVELSGTCAGCASSAQTMKAGVERIVKDRVPGVTEVVQAGGAPVGDGTPVSL
jgi:Fe-S cluster biogenesis protein NfuA